LRREAATGKVRVCMFGIPPTYASRDNAASSVPSQSNTAVAIKRIERAITITADCMARHNLPQLLPTLKRLEAERDKLITDGDPIAYARRVLAQKEAA
jgi:hypothetical protein